MAFSWGGFFGSLGRILPGFMEGRRQAIKDNWQDLENYNNVEMGQLNNIYQSQALPDYIQESHYARDRSELARGNDVMQYMLNEANFPNQFAQAYYFYPYAKQLYQGAPQLQLEQMTLLRQMLQSPDFKRRYMRGMATMPTLGGGF